MDGLFFGKSPTFMGRKTKEKHRLQKSGMKEGT